MNPSPFPTRWRPTTLVLAIALGLGGLSSARADERAELENLRATTTSLIEALVGQGLLSREKADAILRQAAGARPAAAPAAAAPGWGSPAAAGANAAAAPGNVIRVPYLSETQRAQLREEIRNDVLATAREDRWADPRQIPDWVRRIQIDGDLRMRWQSERFADPIYAVDPATGLQIGDDCNIVGGNLPARCYRRQIDSPAWWPYADNTSHGRERMTLRARLGINAKVSDDVAVGLRLSTGSDSGPTSSSQTLGNHFNKSGMVIDRGFLRWEPRYNLRLLAGRMPNVFFASDLVWPDDLSLDGLAVQGELNLAPGAFAFATAGVFPLQEFSLSQHDKWLYAMQVGASWSLASTTTLKLGAAAYDFARVEGVRETALPPTGERLGTEAYLSSQYPSNVRLKGNTLINLNDPTSTAAPTWGLASKFKPVNLTALLTYRGFERIELGLGLDWVHNTGFDLADIRRRAGTDAVNGLAERTTGVQAKLQVGRASLSEAGDWQVSAAYRRFERDAWIDGFTDTTWNLGGTNYKGWQIGGQYAFDRRTTLGLKATTTRNLDDGQRTINPLTGAVESSFSNAPLKIDVLQFDLNTRF
jgi:hypothetical protein